MKRRTFLKSLTGIILAGIIPEIPIPRKIKDVSLTKKELVFDPNDGGFYWWDRTLEKWIKLKEDNHE